ncbi:MULTISPECIES: ABC transporter ATP-binding protein [Bifidobacterium]|jgi:ABC-type multidrug transport system ATPase subunit|uniref:ABC transporter ATP-binding protein n=1 Tax=Bifidobacterium TaxID=1678 RepID=UPI002354EEE5|nr:ABC transporter ATP-binding protein [Bifidobacterium tibiigranuli]MCI1211993.1 ABC transporter ATP-binding protein [Bifidobacterium tibiigranuli]MCI1221745.1 ABC transporter ATP-binding protein [Bifidobacterium tibiigranuli]MCI1232589.1 ABC transporter ATP-binding protein [Bifidobacterium tibiigranuli]MCI1253917.1 ABC transporter ATP-binding protein [Bifidobacterium tibiigranuli]
MSTIVAVDGLRKRFGKTEALRGISFTIQSGEVMGYVGPNGAGKSTTIRTLLGLIKASDGRATIFGKDVWSDAIAIHRRVAYVPGDVYLWPNLTGGEIVDVLLGLQDHGQVNRRRLHDLVRNFDFDPKKKARSYSKGNRQKVALIAALATDADLYIFDEPTSGLDPLMEAVFQQEVEQLKAQGKAILLSSHILSEVERLCDHIVIIRQGRIIENGSLEDMRHLTRYEFNVETTQPATSLRKVPAVHHLEQNGTKSVFQADSDKIQSVLDALRPYEVVRLDAAPQTLEELFLREYAKDGK